jgi:hypothetical protein
MNLEPNQAIKVIEVDPKDGSLWSCHGGTFTWDPPTLNEDGSYTPGAWTPPMDPVLCFRGYHLTNQPSNWWDIDGLKAFLVEFRGKVKGQLQPKIGQKIAVESCRLLRPLTSEELRGYNIFTEGEHVIGLGDVIVHANAQNSTVHVHGDSGVIATNSTVHAYDNASVRSDGDSTVYAHGESTIHTYGNTTIHATGNCSVHAYGNTTVWASEKVYVYASDEVKIHATPGVWVQLTSSFRGTLTQ